MTQEVLPPPVTAETGNTPELRERYRLIDSGTIAIFGEEGAGKSSLAVALARMLNARLLQAGQSMRIQMGGTAGTIGFLERDVAVDKNYDQTQIDLMTEANPGDPLVNESRLAGLLATTEVPQEAGVIRINVTAPARIRMSRIRKRAIKEWESDVESMHLYYQRGLLSDEEYEREGLRLTEKRAELTIEKIRQKETNRRERDIEQWTQAWPRLGGKDPLNPGTLIEGQRLCDLTVSTAKKSKIETLRFVIGWLVENGHMEKVNQPFYDAASEENLQDVFVAQD